MRLNSASEALILRYEVGGGQDYYERFLQAPTWPKGESGVTIGVGYDLGYNSVAQASGDWGGSLPSADLARLTPCCGIKGAAAQARAAEVRDLRIPWAAALPVFEGRTIDRYWRGVIKIYPGADRLDPNCQGALLSLVFNRGTRLADSADKPGDRSEMRAIAPAVAAADYREIAAQLRAMKRLWVGTEIEKGMARRRDDEAALVLQSLGAPAGS